MNRIYLDRLLARLSGEVPELKWTDAEEGQLDFYEVRPPVAFPCCLVEMSYFDCNDLSANNPRLQACRIRATLTVAFDDCASFNTKTPLPVRETAMKRMDLLQKIHLALQGWWDDKFQKPYSRQSCRPEKRSDGIKAYEVIYEAVVLDGV